uniref:cardiolipin synthase (CMP-forming) n=1 Tax=Papio anubis TaxID=9555 RepID=A0A096NVG1_PAPAN
MLALRVARGSWGALRGAAWAPGTRPSKGRACWALLPPVPCCLGCLAERWRLRPAALGLRLPGIGQRNHCSGAGKAAPRPAAGAGAAAEAPGGQWGPASTPSLYENPWTIPNMLSMTRIGLAPVLGYLIIEEDFNIALGVFALAGLTDLLDGFIARNWANQKSALGSALDPLADKILISILYVSLTYADLIPVQWPDLSSLQPLPSGFMLFSRLSLVSSYDYSPVPPYSASFFVFLVEMGFHHVGQAGLKLLTSGDPEVILTSGASASQSAGITGVSHHAWL